MGSDADDLAFTYETSWLSENSGLQIFNFIVESSTPSITSQRNNVQVGTVNDGSNFTNHTSDNFYLGREGNTGGVTDNDPFRGDIAEFILYTSPLNSAQVNIVNNYRHNLYPLKPSLYNYQLYALFNLHRQL